MATHKYPEQIEAHVTSIVENEYTTGQANNRQEVQEFLTAVDMLECLRNEKNYEWMSDIFIPEFPAHILTDASIMANQYFQSRDFVDIYLEDATEEGRAKCRAAKKCINEALNNRKIFHYQKYMRARLINSLGGMVWLKCWWDKESKPEIKGYNQRLEELDVDTLGNPLVDRTLQEPAYRQVQEPVWGEKILVDNFNYDVIDPRDVFYDNKYCYSAQEKDWIIIRSEMTYEELKRNEKKNGYINLDILKDMSRPKQTEGDKEKQREDNKTRADKTPMKPFTVLERFGAFWCDVQERDEDGHPVTVEPGIDEQGEVKEGAELVECIITHAWSDSGKVLIRFQPQFCRTKAGLTYRPIIRGLCYIHPTKDSGLSDGKYARELQIAINDTFNVSQDRTMLATLPAFKGNKYSLEDSVGITVQPEGIIKLDNPREDLIELEIKDNPIGALNQIQVLKSQMDQVMSIYPTTMGELPGQASTTATAIAGSETRSNARANYKSLTVEHTMLVEFYWMSLQMVYQFASEETAVKMMGEEVYWFDPEAEYTYIPLSQNIEMEHSKFRKLQMIDQLIGRVANSMNPKTPALLNKLLIKAFELLGDEWADFKDALLDESAPVMPMGNAPANMGTPAINQGGMPMSPMEMATRTGMSPGTIGQGRY